MSDETSATGVSPRILDFLREHTTLTLATASPNGIPRATSLRYASDGLTLYVWMRSQSRAAQQLAQNPLVSFTIAEETSGVQGSGEARMVLAGDEVASAIELFGAKFLSALGSATMNITFFRIAPTDVKLVDEAYAGGRGETRMFDTAEYRVEEVYNILDELPTADVGVIAGHLLRVEVEPGEVIARQGAPADKFLIVVDGEVSVQRDGPEDVESLGPGAFFGEIAILADRPRTATLTAKTRTTLLTMDRDDFRGLVGQSLGAAGDFDRVLRERLGEG